MQIWDEKSDQVSRIVPDKERARGILKLVELREKSIIELKEDIFATLIAEDYYEIIKELITALMFIDGWKTLSHEMLISYISKYYKEFSQSDIYTIDQMRKIRNDIAYRGFLVKQDYLARNKNTILQIINKLKQTIQRKIG